MLRTDKILMPLAKMNQIFSVCFLYHKPNLQQFCPNPVYYLILCEHVKSSNHSIVLGSCMYASKFSSALVQKKTYLIGTFMADKTKIWSKTFQTPENAILSVSETVSFHKIFIASWTEKLVAKSLQTSLESGFRSTSSSSFKKSSL